jgi:hypothetical protein
VTASGFRLLLAFDRCEFIVNNAAMRETLVHDCAAFAAGNPLRSRGRSSGNDQYIKFLLFRQHFLNQQI